MPHVGFYRVAMMSPKSESTKNTSKTLAEDETSLDCEASFSLKLKKVKLEPKLPFYLILTYVLLTALLGQNHLLLALRETFFLFFSE